MPHVVIENFRHGLDTRRSVLTSTLGVLETLTNAYVNQGGEISKRKSFDYVSITPTGASTITTILGMEALAESIVLFGGEVNMDPGNWPPAGFTYQPLRRLPIPVMSPESCATHISPNYCTNCTEILLETKANSIVHSTVFSGKAFVLAIMSDGTKAAFYDGKSVEDINFLISVLPDMGSNLKLFCMMVRAFVGDSNINTSALPDYKADLRADNTGIRITGNPGLDYNVSVDTTGFSVAPTVSQISRATTGLAGKAASGFFSIQDGAGTASDKITSILVGVEELLTAGEVLYTENPEKTATEVVAAINSGTSGYNAVAQGGTIFLFSDVVGTTDNGKLIKVTTAGVVIIQKCSLAFSGSEFTLENLRINGRSIITAYIFPTASETLTEFVTRLATGITAGVGSHGYVALARDTVLKLSRKVATFATQAPNSVPVVASITGFGLITEDTPGAIKVKVEPATTIVDFTYRFGTVPGLTPRIYLIVVKTPGVTTKPLNAFAFGGVPPYIYNWTIEDQENTQIRIENPNGLSTHIIDDLLPSDSTPGGQRYSNPPSLSYKVATLKVEVVDSKGEKGVSDSIPITFNWKKA